MEFKKFIDKIQNKEYDLIKDILINEPYHLKIKENNNLFIVSLKEESNLDIPLVRDCNGIIVDKDTFEIVCFSFPKIVNNIESHEFIQEDSTIDNNTFTIESIYEGTLIRLYYHNEKWNLSTKNCIDAYSSRWGSNMSHGEMFQECVDSSFLTHLDILDKSLCYSFILIHPENRRCISYKDKTLIHIQTIDLKTMKEVDIDIGSSIGGIHKSEKNIVKLTSTNTYESLINTLETKIITSLEGFILKDYKGNRKKIRTYYYKRLHELFGNYYDRFYHYLILRKDITKLEEFVDNFPHFKNIFIGYENWIIRLALTLDNYYTSIFIRKEYLESPPYLKKIIYDIHKAFLKDRIKTTYEKIVIFIYDMNPKMLCTIKNNMDNDIVP